MNRKMYSPDMQHPAKPYISAVEFAPYTLDPSNRIAEPRTQ